MNRNPSLTRIMILFLLVFATYPSWAFSQEIDPRIKTKKQVAAEGKAGVPQMSVDTLKANMDLNKAFVLLDVRTERERTAGYIGGSVWIPRGVLEFKIQSVCKEADTDIVVYCRKGGRSNLAVKTLQELGYTHVSNLKGGLNAWGEQGYLLYNWHGEVTVIHFDKKDPNLSTFDIFKK